MGVGRVHSKHACHIEDDDRNIDRLAGGVDAAGMDGFSRGPW
jgi:hypothetical protein